MAKTVVFDEEVNLVLYKTSFSFWQKIKEINNKYVSDSYIYALGSFPFFPHFVSSLTVDGGVGIMRRFGVDPFKYNK